MNSHNCYDMALQITLKAMELGYVVSKRSTAPDDPDQFGLNNAQTINNFFNTILNNLDNSVKD